MRDALFEEGLSLDDKLAICKKFSTKAPPDLLDLASRLVDEELVMEEGSVSLPNDVTLVSEHRFYLFGEKDDLQESPYLFIKRITGWEDEKVAHFLEEEAKELVVRDEEYLNRREGFLEKPYAITDAMAFSLPFVDGRDISLSFGRFQDLFREYKKRKEAKEKAYAATMRMMTEGYSLGFDDPEKREKLLALEEELKHPREIKEESRDFSRS